MIGWRFGVIDTLTITTPLFVALGMGIVAGFFSRFHQAHGGINAFVFYVALPAFLFTALARAPVAGGVPLSFIAVVLGVTAGVFFLVFFAGLIAESRRQTGQRHAGPMAVAATYGNVGYLGVPIAMSVVGPEAALGAALGQLLHNMLFMVGYPILVSLRDADTAPHWRSVARTGWTVMRRSILLNPVALSIALGLFVNLGQVRLPNVLDASVEMVGDAAVPAAMFAVGLTIKPAIEAMRSGGVGLASVGVATLVKLLGLPGATLAAIVIFAPELAPSWTAVAVIMAAMPISSTANILVHEYDGPSPLLGATTLVTSLLAVISIPVAVALIP